MFNKKEKDFVKQKKDFVKQKVSVDFLLNRKYNGYVMDGGV